MPADYGEFSKVHKHLYSRSESIVFDDGQIMHNV